MAKWDVFLSHSSSDRPLARELSARLRDRGISCWLDEEQLRPGEPWQQALEEGLKACNSLVLILGPEGIGPWADNEVAYGIREQITDPSFRFVPVLGPGSNPEQIPAFLRTRTFLDLRSADPAAFELLVAALQGRPASFTKKRGRSPKVFLCHAKEDALRIEDLYFKLQDENLDPWYDKKKLIVGDDWEEAILRAIANTDFFTIFLSSRSATKRGFIQKEIRTAIKEYQHRPQGQAYLLPVRLEECSVPPTKLDSNKLLSSLHWIDVFEGDREAVSDLAKGIWAQWNKTQDA
jgi:hypothetical protein